MFIKRGIPYVFMDVAHGEGGEGGNLSGSNALDSNSEGSIFDAISAQGKSNQNAEPSLLSGNQAESSSANQNQSPLSFPEKYTVKNEDGSINIDASTKKLVEGYTNLSKKMGENGGVVPDTADGYKIEFDGKTLGLPENVTPELLQSDPDFKRFLDTAHKAGFSNEQINLVASEYLGVVQSLLDRKFDADINACKTALMENWKTPGEMETGIKNAVKAFNHFASEQDKALMDTIGNNPLIVRVLASVGATMREDSPVRSFQPTESKETIKSLMMSEAYQDTKHPDHEKVNRQVRQFYQQSVGDEVIL